MRNLAILVTLVILVKLAILVNLLNLPGVGTRDATASKKNEHRQFPFLPFVIAVAPFVLPAYFSSLRSGCLRWKRVEPRCEFECGANYFHTVLSF